MGVWIRYTGGAMLLEARPDYMRAAEELGDDLIGVLARAAPLVFPAELEVYGTGAWGGFSAAYVVDVNSGGDLDETRNNLLVLGALVAGLVSRRAPALLRGDGAYPRLPGRLDRLHVVLRPYRLPGTTVRLLLGSWWLLGGEIRLHVHGVPARLGPEDAVIVEGPGAGRVHRLLRAPGSRAPRDYYVIVYEFYGLSERSCRLEEEPRPDAGVAGRRSPYLNPGALLLRRLRGPGPRGLGTITFTPYPGETRYVPGPTRSASKCVREEIRVSPTVQAYFL